MDQPGLDRDLHRQALRGLARVNRVSRTARHFWPELERLASSTRPRPLRVLDVACGGGDVAIALGALASRRQLPIEVRGCDINPTALEYAREQATRRAVEVTFFEHDVLRDPLPPCDAIVCSLFLHHLGDEQALRFLAAAAAAARFSVQVSDLIRSLLGLALAQIGCRLLSRSHVVHVDGPRSVRAAFTMTESRRLAERAGLAPVRVRHRFPERFQLVWRSA